MDDYKTNACRFQALLDERKINYDCKDIGGAMRYSIGLSGFGGLLDRVTFLLFVDDQDAQCYAILPISAKDRLPQMAEFVLRANYGMKYGAFELGYPKGELRLHVTYPASVIEAHADKVFDCLFGVPAVLIKSYGKGFVDVMEGKMTPEEAIAVCKQGMNATAPRQ